jgi:hypothetical protein
MEHFLNLLLGPAGVTVLTLLILFGGWKKWWVFGWYAKDKEAEAAEWKAIALRGTQVAERVVQIAEKSDSNGSV